MYGICTESKESEREFFCTESGRMGFCGCSSVGRARASQASPLAYRTAADRSRNPAAKPDRASKMLRTVALFRPSAAVNVRDMYEVER